MSTTRRWALVGAIAAVSGLGAGSIAVAGAGPAINLNDTAKIEPVADTNGQFGPVAAFDDSPESPDSPNQSPVDSAGSTPDEPGWEDLSPESADSPGSSAADSPAPVRTVRKAPAADSADSPARGGGSANSARSAGSAGSAD